LTGKKKANKALLTEMVEACDGDMRTAVRRYTGLNLADLARRMGCSRSTVNHTLAGYPGRTNAAMRRALELELRLPQYALDELIPGG